MPVKRTYMPPQTRYALRRGAALRSVLAFDTGQEGEGPAVWKILLPGPAGSEDLYGAREFRGPDAAQLTAWLTPIVGGKAAAELVAAVDADPPPAAGWQRTTEG
jgi:hypothetical protein